MIFGIEFFIRKGLTVPLLSKRKLKNKLGETNLESNELGEKILNRSK